MITLKYAEISSFLFAQAMEKISGTPMHGGKASQIHKVTKALGKARQAVTKEYQDTIVETFGKRDEAGKVIRPDGEPMGFEPIEDKETEFLAAQEEFGNKTVELNCSAFTLDLLADVKVSAKDLEALRGLYVGNIEEPEAKPAVPALAVAQ